MSLTLDSQIFLKSQEDVDIFPYISWTNEKLKTAHIIGAEDDYAWVTVKCSVVI